MLPKHFIFQQIYIFVINKIKHGNSKDIRTTKGGE